jgi:hypothetical protein
MKRSRQAAEAGASDESATSMHLLPATQLRSTLCSEQGLSKRAATLLSRECNSLATRLLTRAFAARTALGGPLEAQDVWEALLTDSSSAWLVDRLGLWESGGAADVPLPLPPESLTPDAFLQPRLLWLRGPPVLGPPAPMHESLVEPIEPDETSLHAMPMHPSLLG